jgi:hypothetical protein
VISAVALYSFLCSKFPFSRTKLLIVIFVIINITVIIIIILTEGYLRVNYFSSLNITPAASFHHVSLTFKLACGMGEIRYAHKIFVEKT